ncbi:MAG: SRPBCC family protein [Bacteroidota bacterium]
MAKKNLSDQVFDVQPADRELLMTRTVNAPRELVFEVWTDPRHVVQWWGPKGFTNTVHTMDVRPGGVWSLTMHGPDGVDYPNKIVYKEVIKPERLAWSHGTGDENDPNQFDVSVNFIARGKKTEIVMRMTFKSKEARDMVVDKYGAIEGNKQSMDKLEAYLAKL